MTLIQFNLLSYKAYCHRPPTKTNHTRVGGAAFRHLVAANRPSPMPDGSCNWWSETPSSPYQGPGGATEAFPSAELIQDGAVGYSLRRSPFQGFEVGSTESLPTVC